MNSNDRPTKRFLAEYYHDSANWSIDIYAYDWDDAIVRCNKLGLRLLGEHKLTISGPVGSKWLEDLICWVRNAFGGTGNA